MLRVSVPRRRTEAERAQAAERKAERVAQEGVMPSAPYSLQQKQPWATKEVKVRPVDQSHSQLDVCQTCSCLIFLSAGKVSCTSQYFRTVSNTAVQPPIWNVLQQRQWSVSAAQLHASWHPGMLSLPNVCTSSQLRFHSLTRNLKSCITTHSNAP